LTFLAGPASYCNSPVYASSIVEIIVVFHYTQLVHWDVNLTFCLSWPKTMIF
jgi:hypothetical protein